MPEPRGRDSAGRFLPSRETLARRDTPALLETLQRFGSPVSAQQLEALTSRMTERLIAVPHPSPELLAQEQERIERAVQRSLANEAQQLRQELMLREMGLRGRGARDEMATWVCVGDERTCESCDDRADEEKKMRAWDALGLPGSASLICWSNCRCYLVPEAWVGAEVEDAA